MLLRPALLPTFVAAFSLGACFQDPVPPEAAAVTIWWVDGDSGEIDGVRFRLADVDAPETGPVGSPNGARCPAERSLGQETRRFMDRRTQTGALSFSVLDEDHYGRLVIRLRVDGEDVAQAALEASLLKPWPHVEGRPARPKPDWCGDGL